MHQIILRRYQIKHSSRVQTSAERMSGNPGDMVSPSLHPFWKSLWWRDPKCTTRHVFLVCIFRAEFSLQRQLGFFCTYCCTECGLETKDDVSWCRLRWQQFGGWPATLSTVNEQKRISPSINDYGQFCACWRSKLSAGNCICLTRKGGTGGNNLPWMPEGGMKPLQWRGPKCWLACTNAIKMQYSDFPLYKQSKFWRKAFMTY